VDGVGEVVSKGFGSGGSKRFLKMIF